jgi:hypothetical protein
MAPNQQETKREPCITYYVHVCVYKHIYIYIYMYIYIYIYTHTQTHTHMHLHTVFHSHATERAGDVLREGVLM